MSWRLCPFKVGRSYIVLQPFTCLLFNFEQGEKFTFIGDGYERYDSTTIYHFRAEDDRQDYQWRLHDDEPLETWKELFKPE
jgi:hypothetical protein